MFEFWFELGLAGSLLPRVVSQGREPSFDVVVGVVEGAVLKCGQIAVDGCAVVFELFETAVSCSR